MIALKVLSIVFAARFLARNSASEYIVGSNNGIPSESRSIGNRSPDDSTTIFMRYAFFIVPQYDLSHQENAQKKDAQIASLCYSSSPDCTLQLNMCRELLISNHETAPRLLRDNTTIIDWQQEEICVPLFTSLTWYTSLLIKANIRKV